MARYEVTFTAAAARQLRKLPRDAQQRVVRAIEQLGRDPHPQGVKALQGVDALRLRVGAYRVLYRVEDEALVVLVLRLGHRRDVYDR
jgi:mRNA interferase RelE/StbE